MIRLLDAAITLLYRTADVAVDAAYALGKHRNRLAMRQWEARGDLHGQEPF